jgi:hypothetical protein
MRRDEIEARLDELARELDGPDFVAAVKRLDGELDERGREILAELLLERVREDGAAEYHDVTEEIRENRWRVLIPGTRRRRPR